MPPTWPPLPPLDNSLSKTNRLDYKVTRTLPVMFVGAVVADKEVELRRRRRRLSISAAFSQFRSVVTRVVCGTGL